MSASQGSTDTQEAIGLFTEALRGRIGAERFRLWFTHGTRFEPISADPPRMKIWASGPFAAERIKNSFATELRASAMIALGERAGFEVGHATIDEADANDNQHPAAGDLAMAALAGGTEVQPRQSGPPRRTTSRRNGQTQPLQQLVTRAAHDKQAAEHRVEVPPRRSNPTVKQNANGFPESDPVGNRTLESFVTGPCNDFAFSAAMMATTTPEVATPLFLHGPSGVGKSHLLAALADAFRKRRRMRRVIMLSAEQFTNDFIASVNSTGLVGFRRRYRDVDALLIDDVHFLATKTATLREMLYTVESLAAEGRPLICTANLPPLEIRGLTGEVATRMASGLACPLLPLDPETRLKLLRKAVELRCVLGCDEGLLTQIAELAPGDARGINGIANLIGMLQRMFRREPTLAEIQRYGTDLLRCQSVAPTIKSIERAVCDTFGLRHDGLRDKSQTRRVSEPRMLAMYLAREMTGSASAEIARHFGRRSHTGAITAQSRVAEWLQNNKLIGGGQAALTAHEAIAKIESRLRSG